MSYMLTVAMAGHAHQQQDEGQGRCAQMRNVLKEGPQVGEERELTGEQQGEAQQAGLGARPFQHAEQAGQSYGGLFGLWVAFHEPELFRNYILTSPSIWFADRAVLQSEAAYAATHKDLPARIYLATGSREHPGPGGCADCDNDMIADQSRLATMLKSRAHPSLEIKTNIVEDGFHETTFPIGLMQGLQWLYLKG